MQAGVRCSKSSEYRSWSKDIVYILLFLFLTFVNLFCKYLLLLPTPTPTQITWYSDPRSGFWFCQDGGGIGSTNFGAGIPALKSWLSFSMPHFPPLEDRADSARFIGCCLVEWVNDTWSSWNVLCTSSYDKSLLELEHTHLMFEFIWQALGCLLLAGIN